MLCNVLMWVIAFIVVGEGIQPDTSKEEVMQVLGSKVLHVSDFDNIVEPKSGSNFEFHIRNVRDSSDQDLSFLNVECPNGKCVQSEKEYDFSKNIESGNKERAQLNYANNFLQNREIRGFKVIPLLDDYGLESENAFDENNPNEINDPDFVIEQAQAENITNATKVLMDEIENPNSILEGQSIINDDNQMCCEQEDAKDKKVAVDEEKFIENPKRKLTADDMLEMRFIKHLPKTKGLKTPVINGKSVQNSYHEQNKKKPFQKQAKYNYFALMEENDKLVNSPMDKHRQKRGRKRLDRSLYRDPTYKTLHRRYRLESINSNTFDNGEMTNRPMFLLSNSPNIRSPNKDVKRTLNRLSQNNKYLEEADALIKKVEVALNFNSENKNIFKENENPANTAYTNNVVHKNQDLMYNNRKAIKKEANEDPDFYYEILEKEQMK